MVCEMQGIMIVTAAQPIILFDRWNDDEPKMASLLLQSIYQPVPVERRFHSNACNVFQKGDNTLRNTKASYPTGFEE